MALNEKIKNWIESAVGQITAEESSILSLAHGHFEKQETAELPRDIFNSIHSKQKQRMLGITYTPIEVREQLTDVVLKNLSGHQDITKVRILDPCCGSGAFTVTLLEHLHQMGFNLEDAFQKNAFFYDIDSLSVAVSLLNIQCFLNRHGIDATTLRANARVVNFFEVEEKFDAFITNPPYVKLQNLEVEIREALKERYAEIFAGSLGLGAIFLKKMYDNLAMGGVVGVITQNNFFTSLSGRPLREVLAKHVLKIDTFGSDHVFPEVTAYTCLLYLRSEECENFEYRKIESGQGFDANSVIMKNNSLQLNKWKLGEEREIRSIKKMESKGVPLGEACRIWVGIATQLDRAFTVFNEGGSWSGVFDNQKFEIEGGIVRNLVKISDLDDETSLDRNDRGIIYPYELHGSKAVAIEETDFRDQFPHAYTYLNQWKSSLLTRQKGRINPIDWYKWGRVQSMVPVRGKLLTKTFDREPTFFYDKSDTLFSNGYALIPKSENFDILFVQAVLRSKLFNDYVKATSFEIKGGFFCYQKNFIENFCLPNVDRDLQKHLIENLEIEEFLVEYFR